MVKPNNSVNLTSASLHAAAAGSVQSRRYAQFFGYFV